MAFIHSHDGTEIFYDVHGHGDVNLLLLHGLGGGAGEIWDGVIAQLDLARCRAICPDFRGQGKSSCPSSGYTWDSFSRDILAVADDARAEKFIPVGFSFGGKLACYLAAKRPKRVAAQVLIAPAPLGTMPLDRETGLQLCRDAADWRRTRDFFRSWWFGPAVNEELLDACCKSVAAIPTAVLEACVEMVCWTSIAAEVGRLSVPTLVVTGEQDPVYSAAFQRERLLPFLEQAETAVVSSSHFVPLECPDVLARLIFDFAIKPAVFP